MFGECHAHVIMDGLNYRNAIDMHKNGVVDTPIREHLYAYQKRDIFFVRDGGDNLGVSLRAKELASEYDIDYRTPAFAIYKEGYYGSVVGVPYSDLKEYHRLVKKASKQGADFIKIMISGIMDFNDAGVLSCPSLEPEEIKELIRIAHEEGFQVMAHANGVSAVEAASFYGVDSIEHGNFIDTETMELLKKNETVYVPTIATIGNLRNCGRYPKEEVEAIWNTAVRNIKNAYALKVPTALGSDAGAYLVYHGQGIMDEYQLFHEILGDDKEIDTWLLEGTQMIKKYFKKI